MYELKQSTGIIIYLYMIDSTDHTTPKTGLAVSAFVSKNGAAFGGSSNAVSEVSNGWYKLTLTTTETNTLGFFALYATAAGADQTNELYKIVANIESDTYARIGVAGAGLTDLGGMSNGMKTEVESECNDALVVQKLDHLVAVADGDDPVDNSIISKLAATTGDWSNFVKTTDSLQAIRDVAPHGSVMVGTNNAALAATALSTATWTALRAGYLENINNANLATIADISTLTATEIAHLDADVSSRSSHTPANVRQSVCAVGDPATSIGKILYEIYINRLTATRAGYIDELDFDLDARLGTPVTDISADIADLITRAKGLDNIYDDTNEIQGKLPDDKIAGSSDATSLESKHGTGSWKTAAGPDIADAVWDEPTEDHQTTGSFGKAVYSIFKRSIKSISQWLEENK